MERFTHIDDKGNAVMVDVSGKEVTARAATAAGRIVMSRECYEAVTVGDIAKGDVLGTARVAGIMGAKRTSELIPLCHILNLSKCAVDFIFHLSRRGRGYRMPLYRQVPGADGSGNGSPDGRVGSPAHGVRYVQGRRQENGDYGYSFAGKNRRQERIFFF